MRPTQPDAKPSRLHHYLPQASTERPNSQCANRNVANDEHYLLCQTKKLTNQSAQLPGNGQYFGHASESSPSVIRFYQIAPPTS